VQFNICYFGPERIVNLRRDFVLSMKYGLEDLGHDVFLAHNTIEPHAFNLVVSAYFLDRPQMEQLARSGARFAVVNTEVIKNDLLNHNPEKTDFMGGYLPLMKAGAFALDVIWENLAEVESRYGFAPKFLRWGYHEKLEDIAHKPNKDLDFYFFGTMSQRRHAVVTALANKGFRGAVDNSCPYFIRNDRIARSKIQLNIVQKAIYTHVNSFRICYLANNRCAILSEKEEDGANYLDLARVASEEEFADVFAEMISSGSWQALAEESYAKFRQTTMKSCMEKALDEGFAQGAKAATGASQ